MVSRADYIVNEHCSWEALPCARLVKAAVVAVQVCQGCYITVEKEETLSQPPPFVCTTHVGAKFYSVSIMDKVSNFDAFCDCLSGPVIQSLIVERPKSRERAPRRDKNIAKSMSLSDEVDMTNAADELKEFIDVCHVIPCC